MWVRGWFIAESPLRKQYKKSTQEMSSALELREPSSISVSLLVSSPFVSPGHFHSVCSSTHSPFVYTTLCSQPICLDKEGLARRSFGNTFELHQWLNWDAFEEVCLALWRGCSSNQHVGCFLFILTCLLTSTWCDSEDNLQYCFLHAWFPVILRCQTTICIQSSFDRWTFPTVKFILFYAQN